MTKVDVVFVDVYVLRQGPRGVEALCLRRAGGGRCPGSWETIHGHIEAGERPADAARRELREETGLVPERLYNLSRVESFYVHRRDMIALIPVFCAWVDDGAAVSLSAEHDQHAWLAVDEASRRFAWPRERRALEDAMQLVGSGTAGALEDVLLVEG